MVHEAKRNPDTGGAGVVLTLSTGKTSSVLARRWLGLWGWTVHEERPLSDQYVLIAAPHTSNWDFPIGLLAAKALRLDVHWLGKHSLFRQPFGWMFRGLGGIPVQRNQALNLIQQITALFQESGPLVLALAPEGTRSYTDHWKSGFYHIARAAEVPIVMAYFDHERKRVGLGGEFLPGDDLDETFVHIADFYQEKRGRYPEKESMIRRQVH